MCDFLTSAVRETTHRGSDDLLSAGMGLNGLRATPPAFADPSAPTPEELRRNAMHMNWRGIADLGPLGGYGSVYGAVPNVPGREFSAFARIPGATVPHRVLAQIPDDFDARRRCLVVAAPPGSRGVYGAIALAGAWGLPRGCAVAYTDKACGSGYFDLDSQAGVALDGTRASRSDHAGDTTHSRDALEFEPEYVEGASGVAIKHAHSGGHPEADWGRHVLQAAQFGLAMLDRAYPARAPFTAQNTRVIATGLSNAAASALLAAGLDTEHTLSGVVALSPNVHVADFGRPLYDYTTEAALLMPAALCDAQFETTPFARVNGSIPAQWLARCAHLHAQGVLEGADANTQAREALERLRAHGWEERALATAASTTTFDLWRALGATYASAYLRRGAHAMPCGFSCSAVGANGAPQAADAPTRAAWWAEASGIAPGAGVMLLGGIDASHDPTASAIEGLRALWTGADEDARRLRSSVAETAARIPRDDLPILVAHGEDDGLLPIAFSSAPYVAALENANRKPVFWRIPHAQHFDAFLALPDFGARYVPLLPYAYAALDRMHAHLFDGEPLPSSHRFDARPRGPNALEASAFGLGGDSGTLRA
ncbi:MAG: 3-hydroxybutyrate oligomer hydrolase family protein [Rhodanobacteraceae bacterium]